MKAQLSLLILSIQSKLLTSTTNKDTDLRPMIDGCGCYSNGLLECTGLCGNNQNGYNNSILII
jgi:hypothetical protein